MLTCRAILFDLDGVLADSIAAVERAWRAFADRHALDGDDIVTRVHGRRAVDSVRAIAPHADVDAEIAWLEAMEAGDTSDVVALPGAAEVLHVLPPDRWTVVTSGTRPVAEARLRAAGLPIPRHMVAAGEITRGKPDPEGYLRGADRLGVAPTDCVVVEDAPPGAAAARAAGMGLLALTTTHDAAAMAGADLVVPNLAAVEVTVHGDRIVIASRGRGRAS
ncbi:HAD-superfamily hydrolase, subfamily IA, variant 3 [Gemmatirosa kalamazoonensis]|jgi:sugar-phosphatase|uniref:HAD-superfamily hydrolase, subfamily IA, variant 3 n=1 Tax=Gemmatirosa kalamazoonensis TaxID=861299 RepID=W0RD83_9BACT|nr:HAD-IA family hydrolase [Gemmatirosa kalamazoonensis]AHG88270.1 HAD-superfamily hydrolase, subfamily IA, variant 3 [Gemmatirosa kalamazoonensis]